MSGFASYLAACAHQLELDIAHIVSAINGYVRADRSTEDTLRPQYVDYLLEHL